jgi:two-component system response regulator MprA
MSANPGPILVVEDEPDLREVMVGILEGEGYRAIAASDGQDALRVLESNPERPSLILLDLMMPRMDGWTFRETQQRDERFSAIPVVVVTAFGSKLDMKPVDAVDLVRKPIDFDRLLTIVERYSSASPSA